MLNWNEKMAVLLANRAEQPVIKSLGIDCLSTEKHLRYATAE